MTHVVPSCSICVVVSSVLGKHCTPAVSSLQLASNTTARTFLNMVHNLPSPMNEQISRTLLSTDGGGSVKVAL